MSVTEGEMRADWLDLTGGLGVAEPTALPVYLDLCRRYSEAGRAYHTLAHVGDVLRALARGRDALGVGDWDSLRLAAWFHDAVYDPRAADNEERSAALAAQVLKEWRLAEDLRARVQTLILATKMHQAGDGDGDMALFLDADLATLGAAPDEYARYSEAIRREFAWVPDDAYRTGRSRVLTHFLERPRLYRTALFADKLEDRARQNLRREIAELTA